MTSGGIVRCVDTHLTASRRSPGPTARRRCSDSTFAWSVRRAEGSETPLKCVRLRCCFDACVHSRRRVGSASEPAFTHCAALRCGGPQSRLLVKQRHQLEVTPVELAIETLESQRGRIQRQLDAQPVLLAGLQRELQV
jgi:hypothetical protein